MLPYDFVEENKQKKINKDLILFDSKNQGSTVLN